MATGVRVAITPRLHGVQAAELSNAEVQAELPGPGRVQKVLPLVQTAHRAPGDALALGVWRGRRVKNGARGARSRSRPSRVGRRSVPRSRAQRRQSDSEPRRPQPGEERHVPGSGLINFLSGVGRRAQEGGVAESEGRDQRHCSGPDRLRHRRRLSLAERSTLEVRRAAPVAAIERIECFAGT